MQAANDILAGKREDYANMKKGRYNMKKKKYAPIVSIGAYFFAYLQYLSNMRLF